MSEAPETIYIQSPVDPSWSDERLCEACIGFVREDIVIGANAQIESLLSRIATLESTLRHIAHNCWGMTTHGIETMAREALEKS